MDEIPFFAPATGMAQSAFGSGVLVLNDEGNNYLDRERLATLDNGYLASLVRAVRRVYQDDTPSFPSGSEIFLVCTCMRDDNETLRFERTEYIVLSFS